MLPYTSYHTELLVIIWLFSCFDTCYCWHQYCSCCCMFAASDSVCYWYDTYYGYIYTVVIITSKYEMCLTSLRSYPETFFTLFSLLKWPIPQNTDKRYLTWCARWLLMTQHFSSIKGKMLCRLVRLLGTLHSNWQMVQYFPTS